MQVSKSIVAVQASNGRTPRTPPRQDSKATLFNLEAMEDLVRPSSEKAAAPVKNADPLHQLRHGRFLDSNRLLYRQKFVIRSYEVGADKATSITTIFSFFQVCIDHSALCVLSNNPQYVKKKQLQYHRIFYSYDTEFEYDKVRRLRTMTSK